MPNRLTEMVREKVQGNKSSGSKKDDEKDKKKASEKSATERFVDKYSGDESNSESSDDQDVTENPTYRRLRGRPKTQETKRKADNIRDSASVEDAQDADIVDDQGQSILETSNERASSISENTESDTATERKAAKASEGYIQRLKQEQKASQAKERLQSEKERIKDQIQKLKNSPAADELSEKYREKASKVYENDEGAFSQSDVRKQSQYSRAANRLENKSGLYTTSSGETVSRDQALDILQDELQNVDEKIVEVESTKKNIRNEREFFGDLSSKLAARAGNQEDESSLQSILSREVSSKVEARRVVASAVQKAPDIADYARAVRKGNREMVVERVRNDPTVSMSDVEKYNQIVSGSNLKEDNLNVVEGVSSAEAASDTVENYIEGNPVSRGTGRLFSGLQLAGGELADVVTGNSRLEISEAERAEEQRTQEEISQYVTGIGSEFAKIPGLIQATGGVGQRALSGDTGPVEVGGQAFDTVVDTAQGTVESFQEDPYTASAKTVIGAVTLAGGYYASTYAKTGRTPSLDTDLEASTLAKKARSKSRDIEESLRVAGEPVKSTDKYRARPASREGMLPTGKGSNNGNPGGTTSNAFPTDLRSKVSLSDLARGNTPAYTEKVRDIFYLDSDKARPGRKVEDGRVLNIREPARADQETLEMLVDDVQETGRMSGLEALTSDRVDVRVREDVSKLVDVADDSGSSRGSSKGQVAISRKKTRSETADTTGRNIDSQDRRRDVADDTPEYYDTTRDMAGERQRQFNNPRAETDLGVGAASGLAASQEMDVPGAAEEVGGGQEYFQFTDQEVSQFEGQAFESTAESTTFEFGERTFEGRIREGSGRGSESGREGSSDSGRRRDRDLDLDLPGGGSASGRRQSSSARSGRDPGDATDLDLISYNVAVAEGENPGDITFVEGSRQGYIRGVRTRTELEGDLSIFEKGGDIL